MLATRLVNVSVPVPVYLNVTFVFVLATLIVWSFVKVTLAGVNDSELVPVPVSPTNCGFVGSLSWMISVAFFAPVLSGSNFTPMTHLVVIAPVQVLLAMVKSVVSPSSVADVAV